MLDNSLSVVFQQNIYPPPPPFPIIPIPHKIKRLFFYWLKFILIILI